MCKLPTPEQIQHIMDLKELFKQQICKLHKSLECVDSGCHNDHYVCTLRGCMLKGHPSLCITLGCDSKLRILRAVSPHYPMLHKFLSYISMMLLDAITEVFIISIVLSKKVILYHLLNMVALLV